MSTVSGLARETMRAFLEVIALAEPMIADLWKSHHLTLSHVQCMRTLREQPEVAGDLARKLNMSSASLTRVLDRLEERDFVIRTIDPSDRRRILVHLTPLGKDILSGIKSWYRSPVFTAISAMDEESLRVLRQGLANLASEVKQTIDQAPK